MAPPGIDLKLRLSLREGSVYYFTERTLTSPEPHYFIVVNAHPLTQQVLLLSVVTSKVEEVKHRIAARTVSPRLLNSLRKTSISSPGHRSSIATA